MFLTFEKKEARWSNVHKHTASTTLLVEHKTKNQRAKCNRKIKNIPLRQVLCQLERKRRNTVDKEDEQEKNDAPTRQLNCNDDGK